MLVIRVTFADGATEDREDASPARPLPFLGGSIALGKCREYEVVRVERNGKWVKCRVESYPEQIARLEGERDATHQKYVLRDAWALLWKGWAREFLRQRDAESQRADRWRADYDHKQEEWSSSCDILAAERDVEKARADAAEKRLADLRAWADDIVKRSYEEAPKHPGNANTTWTILSVLEWVVARIDGKEG